MQIEYYTKHVYGNELIYVIKNDYTDAVRMLTGRTTLTKSDMEALMILGVKLERVFEPAEKAVARWAI